MYFRVKKMIVPRFILSETTLMGHVRYTLLSVIDKAMEAKPQMTEFCGLLQIEGSVR